MTNKINEADDTLIPWYINFYFIINLFYNNNIYMEQRQHLYRQVLVADINMEFYQRKKRHSQNKLNALPLGCNSMGTNQLCKAVRVDTI